MSLTEILEEVEKLNPDEQEQVISVLLKKREAADEKESNERLLQHMLDKGMISRIPPRRKTARVSRPVRIIGKPLSETIIEERR